MATSASLIVTSNVQTKVSTEKVWQIMSDFHNWKSWDSGLTDVKMNNGRLDENAEGDMMETGGATSHFRVTRLQPDFTYTLETRLPFAKVYTRRILGYHNYKTIITHEVWIEGALRDFWGFLLGKRYERRMKELNAKLAELVEK
jgi:hypothetical protein